MEYTVKLLKNVISAAKECVNILNFEHMSTHLTNNATSLIRNVVRIVGGVTVRMSDVFSGSSRLFNLPLMSLFIFVWAVVVGVACAAVTF